MMELYDRIVDPALLIRRVTLNAINLANEDNIPIERKKGVIAEQFSLFDDLDTEEEKLRRDQKAAEEAAEKKERKLQKAALLIQSKYGKNAILKGTNFLEGATTRERNSMIGGHRSGENTSPKRTERNVQEEDWDDTRD